MVAGILLQDCVGFEWDEGNLDKNRSKHQVSHSECEQIFFNHPLLLCADIKHYKKETRMYVLGKTNLGRLLFVAFTVRNHLVRVTSARDMSRKERGIYEKKPSFKSLEAEKKFWQHHDSVDYLDWDKAALASFPNLKPSTETISLRLPISLLNEIKTMAHKEDVPYQSLIKIMLAREINLLRRQITLE